MRHFQFEIFIEQQHTLCVLINTYHQRRERVRDSIMSCFSLASSSGSSFCSFTPRRDGGRSRKQHIIAKKMRETSTRLRSMTDRRRNSSGGDFDEDESDNNKDKEDKDPDEISFLSSRDGERYNNMNNNKEENKNISSI